jgi:activator of HSP90 ATPase
MMFRYTLKKQHQFILLRIYGNFQAQNIKPVANHVTTNKSTINDGKTKASVEKTENKTLGVKIDCKTLVFEERFQCKANELYDCFSKKELMTAFTRGDVKLDFVKNGE